MESFTGFVYVSAFNFAPRDFAFCSGQIISVAENSALYSLLGTTYGGDGRSTFGIPDLRGRVPVGSIVMGNPPGLTPIQWGQLYGAQSHQLGLSEMPAHNHTAVVTAGTGTGTVPVNTTVTVNADSTGASNDPTGKYWAQAPNIGLNSVDVYGSGPNIEMATNAVEVSASVDLSNIPTPEVTIGDTGGSSSFGISQPSLGMAYVICMDGLYPPRN